jgi:hypothetical protein
MLADSPERGHAPTVAATHTLEGTGRYGMPSIAFGSTHQLIRVQGAPTFLLITVAVGAGAGPLLGAVRPRPAFVHRQGIA